MKKVKKTLLAAFMAVLAVAALLILLFECHIAGQGLLAGLTMADFTVECVMVILTIVVIPLALRLFKFKGVHRQLSTRKEEALRRWGILRMMMLGVPLWLNVVCYYLFLNPGYSYLALILFLSMWFVFPTLEKCYAETE